MEPIVNDEQEKYLQGKKSKPKTNKLTTTETCSQLRMSSTLIGQFELFASMKIIDHVTCDVMIVG